MRTRHTSCFSKMDEVKIELNHFDSSMLKVHTTAEESDTIIQTDKAKKRENEVVTNTLTDKLQNDSSSLHKIQIKQNETDLEFYKNISTEHREDDMLCNVDLKHEEGGDMRTVTVIENESNEQKERDTIFIKQEVVDTEFETGQSTGTDENANSEAKGDILYKPVILNTTELKVEPDVEIKVEPYLKYRGDSASNNGLFSGMRNTSNMVNLAAADYAVHPKENINKTRYVSSGSFEMTKPVTSGISLIKTKEKGEITEIKHAVTETVSFLKPVKQNVRKRRFPVSNAVLDTCKSDPNIPNSSKTKRRRVEKSGLLKPVETVVSARDKITKLSRNVFPNNSSATLISCKSSKKDDNSSKVMSSVTMGSVPLVKSHEKKRHLKKETAINFSDSDDFVLQKARKQDITTSDCSDNIVLESKCDLIAHCDHDIAGFSNNVRPDIFVVRPRVMKCSKPRQLDQRQRNWLFLVSVPASSKRTSLVKPSKSTYGYIYVNPSSDSSLKLETVSTATHSKYNVITKSQSDSKNFNSPGCSTQKDEKTVNLASKNETAYSMNHLIQPNVDSVDSGLIQEQSPTSQSETLCDKISDSYLRKDEMSQHLEEKEVNFKTDESKNIIKRFADAVRPKLQLDKLFVEPDETVKNQVINLLAQEFESRILDETSTDGSFELKSLHIEKRGIESYEEIIAYEISKVLGPVEKKYPYTWAERMVIKQEILKQLQPEIVTKLYQKIQTAFRVQLFGMELDRVSYEVKNMGRSFFESDNEFRYIWLVTSNLRGGPLCKHMVASIHTQKRKNHFNFPELPLAFGQPDFKHYNEEFSKFVRTHGSEISVDMQTCHRIEFLTKDNLNSDEVKSILAKRLPASRFGYLLKVANCARKTLKEDLNVRLSKEYISDAVSPKYSQKWLRDQMLMKQQALAMYLRQKKIETKVIHLESCGVVINPAFPHLAAMPDWKVFLEGKENGLGIILVYCPKKYINLTSILKSANFKNFCLSLNDENMLCINRYHDCYFEIQGSIAITGVEWCDFLVYTKKELHVERVKFDGKTWEEIMFPKYSRFYVNHVFGNL